MAKKHQTHKKEKLVLESPKNNLLYQRLAIALLTLVLYGSSIGFDYTLDDTLMITGNEYTKKGFDGIKEIFVSDAFTGFFGNESSLVAGGRYRPFTHFMFAVEKEIFGFNPHIGHALNVFFYLLLLMSLFAFLKKILPERAEHKKWYQSLPFIITLLFAAHPLHTEVISNIKGRDEIVAMLGAILSMHLLIIWLEKKKIYYLILSAVLFFIALLSKENVITCLGVFPFILWFFTSAKRKDYFITIAVLSIPSIIFIYIRSQIVGGVLSTSISPELLNNPFIHSTKTEEIATVIFTWLLYFKLIIFPHPLTHDYYPKQIAITNFEDPLVWIAVILVLASIFLAIKGLKKKKIWSFAIILFWASFSISSNLLFNIGTFMNERFMFVPLLGFTFILAYYLLKNTGKNNISTYILIAILGLYSIKTISRSFAWKNNFTLFMTDVKTSKNSAKVNVSAAELLLQNAEAEPNIIKRNNIISEAISYLNRAQEIHPNYYGVYDLRGKAWFMMKDYNKSFTDYQQCMILNPNKQSMLNNIYLLGIACNKDTIAQTGKDIFNYLIKIQADSARNYFQMAILYSNINKWDSSMIYINTALEKDSSYVPALNKAGEIHGRVYNDFKKSEFYLLKAYSFNPTNVSVLENLGVLYGISGKFEQSKSFLLKAHRIKPEDVQIKINLSQTYLLLGMQDSAVYYRGVE